MPSNTHTQDIQTYIHIHYYYTHRAVIGRLPICGNNAQSTPLIFIISLK